uniref:Odorant response abnormal protein 4 n=1 Tax=Onchocerca volvulus TaxID=6282 RepID=A0A8R1U0R7_ONCVO
MILLDKCLESLLDCYIREHCDRQRKYGIAGSAGFLIGSKMDEDFHVAHIAMCAYPDTIQDETGDIYSKSIDADWIADIGSRVLRFLPGGTMIVGLLWLADSKSSLQSAQIRGLLVRALSQIAIRNSALSSLNIKPVDNCLALIGVETPLGRPFGCNIDCSRKGAAGSQTKVSFNQLEWIRLESSAAFRLSEPLTDGIWDFHKQFTSALHEWAEHLLKTNVALVNGLSRSRDEFLRPRERKNRGLTMFDIETFLNADEKDDLDNQNISSFCTIDLIVDIVAKAAVPSKATVGQAIDAVKEHIIRSLCSRAELHYESTDVIEDEPKDRLAVHQLPRAAYVSLPSQKAIVFTDYLFESDTANDAQQSFAEFLSLKISENDIDINSERHLDGNDLLNMLNEDDRPCRVERSSSSTSSLSSVILPSIHKTGWAASINYYFLIAALIALLSFVVYLLMKTISS